MTGRPTARTTQGLSRLCALALATASSGGCAEPAPDVVPIEVRIASSACRPTSVRAVRLSLLGDFAPAPTDTLELLTAGGVRDLAGLRPDLRTLFVEVEGEPDFAAFGRSSLEAARATGVVSALPLLRPCTLVDPDAVLAEGAALVAHPDGSAWIAGGRGSERRIARIDPRSTFAEVRPDALFNPRVGATATIVGDAVVVAGGAGGTLDRAYDSYELLAPDLGPATARPGGTLSQARRDHAAVVVGGALVLVGGRTGGAEDRLVDRVDVVDVARGESRQGPALATPRARPVAFAASDGSVLVLGGRDAAGRLVETVERIEPDLGRARTLETELPAPDLVVGLTLDRALHVAGAEVRVVSFRSDPPRVELLARRTALMGPIGVASRNGRVLLVGRRADGAASAELWAPHVGTSLALEAARVADGLALLADGTVLEVASAGASYRMLEEPDVWATLPNDQLFFPTDLGAAPVVAGLPGDLDGARAVRSGSTLAVAPLRFGALSLEPSLEGAASLRLVAEDGGGVSIEVDAVGNVLGPGCELEAGDGPLVVVREAARLELVRGATRARCTDLDPASLLGVEVVLDRGSELRALRASRRLE
jgi:hypothetical protein